MYFKMKSHEYDIQITDDFPNKQMLYSKLRPNICVLFTVNAFPNLESHLSNPRLCVERDL